MSRIGWAVVAVLVAVAYPVTAPLCGDESGGQPSAYLEWGVGARPVAMGGAYTAIAEGPIAALWNPAGIGQMDQDGFEAALRKMSFDRKAGYAAFAHPIGTDQAALGFSWVYAGVGDLFEIDLSGNRGESISDFTNAATFTFGRRFTEEHSRTAVFLGLNLRYAQHNIAGISAYSIGFDLGALARYRLQRRPAYGGEIPSELRFGASVQRLNQKYPWSTSDYWIPQGEDGGSSFEEKFPFLVRTGVALVVMQGRLIGAFDVVADEKQGAAWHVGAEGTMRDMFAVRAGVDDGDPSFGLGFRPKLKNGVRFLIDYAYAVQPDVIDAEHLFSLGIRF